MDKLSIFLELQFINPSTLTENDLYSGNVLNGITYNEVNKTFLITGKEWGYLYEVELN